jgi:hypothetical protein
MCTYNLAMIGEIKTVATMVAEGVEQLQPTALETTTTGTCAKGCVMVYRSMY